MIEAVKSRWGSFWCWFLGYHRGNVQWGESDLNGNLIHKCSACWRPVKNKQLKVSSKENGIVDKSIKSDNTNFVSN